MDSPNISSVVWRVLLALVGRTNGAVRGNRRAGRHNGAGSKSQNSEGSREHENCNLAAGSEIFVSKKASESKP